jgi:dephospho-CoA kinase
VAEHLLAPPVNVLRLGLHPAGLAARIVNHGEWRAHLLDRLHRQSVASADPALTALHAELAAYPVKDHGPRPGSCRNEIAVVLRLAHSNGELRFISTVATFGTAVDVTMSELAIESFYPADARRPSSCTPGRGGTMADMGVGRSEFGRRYSHRVSVSQLPLAVVGMAGAGKSEVTEMLVGSHGFERIYFGQVVLDEIAAQGLAPGAESERAVRERLRAAEGMEVMAARSLPRIRAALSNGHGVCIDGLYSGAEWQLLARDTGVITVAVHAPRCLRKSRLAERPIRPLTGAELDIRDLAEVDCLDKAKPIALADAHVVNDGSLDVLRERVESILKLLDKITAARLHPVSAG